MPPRRSLRSVGTAVLLKKSIYDHWAAALRLSGKCGPQQLQHRRRPIALAGRPGPRGRRAGARGRGGLVEHARARTRLSARTAKRPALVRYRLQDVHAPVGGGETGSRHQVLAALQVVIGEDARSTQSELRALRSVSQSHVQDPTEVQGGAVTIAAAAYEPYDPCALTRSS